MIIQRKQNEDKLLFKNNHLGGGLDVLSTQRLASFLIRFGSPAAINKTNYSQREGLGDI